MEQKKLQLIDIIAIICAAITAIINIIAYFVLPDTIVTQITFSGENNYTSTIMYLALSMLLVLITSGMTVFTDRKNKWIAMTAVLVIINIICITLNLL